MRTFAIGSAADRKLVVIGVKGPRLRLTQKKADGTTKRSVKELGSDDEARAESERAARELLARGYVEQTSARPAAAKSAARGLNPDEVNVNNLFEDSEEPAERVEPVLSRLAGAPGAARTAEVAPKKKKKPGGKKKGKKPTSGDALDKRVIGGVAAIGAVIVAVVGYVAYDAFLKPSSIVGGWAGSMIDFEIGKPIVHNQYSLVLDDKKHASLTLQEKFTSVGTYSLKGNRLKLTLKDQIDDKEKSEKPEESEASVREYKIALGRSTLDLSDPATGKKWVQLIRLTEKASVAKKAGPADAPKDLAASAAGPVDKAADDRLASVEFAAKDGAFKLRHPPGWETETGSRPDNTYSWVSCSKDSAKMQIYADIAGSLMSGSDSAGQHEEGSELAPVHSAHMLYQKTAAGEFSDYKETRPTLFKGAPLGEGRIASFTATGGGLLGSKLRGYRITLLTNDRRVSILCSCPEGEFAALKPTFLAVARSLGR